MQIVHAEGSLQGSGHSRVFNLLRRGHVSERERDEAEFVWRMDIAAFPWRYVSSFCLDIPSNMDGYKKRNSSHLSHLEAGSQRETDTS